MSAFYKLLICVLSLYYLMGCTEDENKKKPITFFYTGFLLPKYNIESITVDKIMRHNAKDSLISSLHFNNFSSNHTITMYTNAFYAPQDGGTILYELDSLGVIYGKSTTWRQHRRLHSNNDSIDEIINTALEHIILHSQLDCYQCQH
ncbi:hypothetical protein [Hymenobacter roseosalivarius]|uniref:hypothetical protein n=1 Tax=Hymenobacter roseosalivarius TaxID=89967 RepID=UPI001179DAA7|nr:hypothetical protein [Hymenobacter roseosalivarius]